jgi:hypothetical protein
VAAYRYPDLDASQVCRLYLVDVDQRALAQAGTARHPDVGIGDVSTELVARVRDVLRADVKADYQAFLVLRLVEEKVLRPPGHAPAMAGADLGALRALPHDAMTLEIYGDLVAAAVQVLRVRRARPEYRMEDRVLLPCCPEIGSRNSEIAQPSPFFMFSGWTSSTWTSGYLSGIGYSYSSGSGTCGAGTADQILRFGYGGSNNAVNRFTCTALPAPLYLHRFI